MSQHYLHNFRMLSLTKIPLRTEAQWQIVSRAGVDGSAIWKTGTRGRPFQVLSKAFAVDLAAARELFRQYLNLQKAAFAITIDFAGEVEPGIKHKVLAVEPTDKGCCAIEQGMIAGDATVYRGYLECVWTLLPLDQGQLSILTGGVF